MGETELSDWFVAAAQRAARSYRLKTELRDLPEPDWQGILEAVETLARMSEERIPVGWREMLAAKVGRTTNDP